MTSELSEPDIKQSGSEKSSYNHRRINSNQIMLDLRHQVQHQERMIRNLIAERDGLTRELDSRLFLVEAQLRREQKHIEAVLTEKEQLIQFQALQIHSLKQVLSQVSHNQNHYQRNHRSSKRSLSKRYSVALDECMKDHCIVSRALPVMVNGENETLRAKNMKCNRTRSLPELRFKEMIANQEFCHEMIQNQLMNDRTSTQQWCHLPSHVAPKHLQFNIKNLDKPSTTCCRNLSHDILDELSSRRWASDCDSEHSDSLDSGISSPSIKSRNMHDNFGLSDQDSSTDVEKKNANYAPSRRSTTKNSTSHDRSEPEFRNDETLNGGNQKPRRSSSIGNFINRTFSSSSSEKMKDNHDATARRHSSFSGAEVKDLEPENTVQKPRLINSTNRTFGTNHRSVTKPRDIKFRKLFKFRRRTEPDPVISTDYMTV